MKRLKLSATPEDMSFLFELIPNTFMLREDQRPSKPQKVRYFAVDSNEVKAEWMKFVIHATNDRRLEEGHVTNTNGEMWTLRE